MNTTTEAIENSGNLARFTSLALAVARRDRQAYNTPILLGDDGRYWVPATNRIAARLIRGGYEVAPNA